MGQQAGLALKQSDSLLLAKPLSPQTAPAAGEQVMKHLSQWLMLLPNHKGWGNMDKLWTEQRYPLWSLFLQITLSLRILPRKSFEQSSGTTKSDGQLEILEY